MASKKMRCGIIGPVFKSLLVNEYPNNTPYYAGILSPLTLALSPHAGRGDVLLMFDLHNTPSPAWAGGGWGEGGIVYHSSRGSSLNHVIINSIIGKSLPC